MEKNSQSQKCTCSQHYSVRWLIITHKPKSYDPNSNPSQRLTEPQLESQRWTFLKSCISEILKLENKLYKWFSIYYAMI